MQDTQQRPHRLRRRQPDLADNWADGWQVPDRDRPRLSATLRALRRSLTILVWTVIALPIQALLLVVPGPGKVVFARIFWAGVCRLLGLRVQVIGAPIRDGGRVVFVSNHSSWLDIPALGGRLPACFVSKDQVGKWPLVGTIARLGRTVFVSRQRSATGRERDDMRGRLAAGDSLILFPEGTSSDGARVLPFRSAFFAAAEGPERPLIQPISLVYDRLAGLPMVRAARPIFAWYGDMALGPHFWGLAQLVGCRATILMHPPIDPANYASRKELSAACWRTVAEGAAALRQNRPARPVVAGAIDLDPEAEPAHA